MKIPRRTYVDLYGPTVGDRVRLGDTALLIEIEKDFARYGEEVVFGGYLFIVTEADDRRVQQFRVNRQSSDA